VAALWRLCVRAGSFYRARITGWVEKRSQLIENTLEPGSFFMKLRRPEGVGDKPETIHPVA
jgi:hypothetical protein